MSKYAQLRDYLANRKTGPWHARFTDVEQILGFPLPASARKYPAWWANQNRGSHVQCSGWLNAGWHTSNVDLENESVTFIPTHSRKGIGSAGEFRPTKSSLKWQDVLAPGGASTPTSFNAEFSWHLLGELYVDQKVRIVFPRVPLGPAVYSFKLSRRDQTEYYFGETEEVALRFQHYRTPGPSQRTNQRLNKLMADCIGNGGSVIVSIAQDISLHSGGLATAVCLSDKHIRRLIEAAAVTLALSENKRVLNL